MRTIRLSKAEFDGSKQIRETEDELIVPTILTREAILPFADGKGYRSAEELKAAAWTLEGSWVVALSHIDTVFVTDSKDIRGKISNVRFCDQINGVLGDAHFFKARCDKTYLDGVRSGKYKDVSVAYFCEDIFTPGKFGDEPYDFVQQKFMFGHVAAGVPEGRCPSPFCGMSVDSLLKPHKDPEETEDFVHIRVRDPDLFVDGSFRTIDIDAEKGIKAVIGKLKSDPEGSTVVQKFIFDKSKDWTMEKAQAWVKEHKDSAEAMSEEESKQKIEELNSKRTELVNKLYPQSQLTPEDEEKVRMDLELLDLQLNALMKILAEKQVKSEPAADSLDSVRELERSRRLLSQ